MKRNSLSLSLAGLLALASLAVHAESPDPSGQFAIRPASKSTRAEVRTELQQFQASGVNPWADQYDQLAGFRATKTRAEVRADYMASREEVKAMTGEDSGSVYLASRKPVDTGRFFAGQPAR